MTVPRVVGFDLSSTRPGRCDPDGFTANQLFEGPKLQRATEIRDWCSEILDSKIELVVKEGIGTRMVKTAIPIAYVHCLLELRLAKLRIRWIDVSSGQLRKFALGTGKAGLGKAPMVTAAMKAGWESAAESTDDEAEAYWLWAFGRHILGAPVVNTTTYRADLVVPLRRGATS